MRLLLQRLLIALSALLALSAGNAASAAARTPGRDQYRVVFQVSPPPDTNKCGNVDRQQDAIERDKQPGGDAGRVGPGRCSNIWRQTAP